MSKPMGFYRREHNGRLITHPLTKGRNSTWEPQTRIYHRNNNGPVPMQCADGSVLMVKNRPRIRGILRGVVRGLGSARALPARTRAAFEEGEIAKLIEDSQSRDIATRIPARRAFRRRFPEIYEEFIQVTR